MLPANQATASDFDSHAKKNPAKKYPSHLHCKASSTSLITSLEVCRSIAKSPSPNVKNLTHAVEVKHDPSAGIWDHNGEHHVSLWLAANFNPLDLTGKVEEL